MSNKKFLLIGIILGIIFILRCTVEEDKFLSPTESPSKYIIFKSLSATKNRLLTQGDSCIIQLEIVDPSNNPPDEGIVVNFSAEMGTITPVDTSDSSGRAFAQYISGISSGIEKITVKAGEKEDSLFLVIIDRTATVSLSTDTTEILADGESTVRIKANIKDENNSPLTGMTVFFSTNKGQIIESGVSDQNGETYTTLTSVPDSNDVVATVKASLTPFNSPILTLPKDVYPDVLKGYKGSKSLIKSMKKIDRNDEIKRINKSVNSKKKFEPIDNEMSKLTPPATNKMLELTQVDSLNITFKGITITLDKDKTKLLANGEDKAIITLTMFITASGLPLVNKSFSKATDRGLIIGDDQTDSNGKATVQLISSTTPGVATVTITVGTGLSFSTQIPFVSAYPTYIQLSLPTPSILSDGESSTTLTANVTDTLGNPVTGAIVQFVTDAGSLTASQVTTDNQGQASVELTSIASKTDKTGWVNASILGYTHVRDSVQFIFRGVTISSYSENESIISDGLSSTEITASIFETTTKSAIANREVYFSTSLGTINSPAITNINGQAITTLTAGILPGTASVVIYFGDLLSDTISVSFLGHVPSSLFLSQDEESLLADGESTTAITAEVTDTLENAVEGVSVHFETDLGSLSSSNVFTDENGLATVNLTSIASSNDVTANIFCTVDTYPPITIMEDRRPTNTTKWGQLIKTTDNRNLTSKKQEIGKSKRLEVLKNSPTKKKNGLFSNIQTSLMDTVQVQFKGVTIESYSTDDPIMADGISTTTIVSTIFETSTNVPIQDAQVTFATDLGIITGSSTTNSKGTATATLISSINAGTATIVVSFGSTLYDTLTVTFLSTEPNQLTLSSSTENILADGESNTTITATVVDISGNPVSGTTISFDTNLGSLSDTSIQTDSFGEAQVELISIVSSTDQVAEITATVDDAPEVTSNISITFRGVTVNVSADPSQIYADGTSTSTIAIGLYETTSGNPISNHEFTLATTNGIIPAGGATDAFGTATSTLTSSTTPGTAIVTVTAGVSESTTVQFLSTAPTNISLTSSSSTILADGESTTTITAEVTDTMGNPVTGATVYFSADIGELSELSVNTDENGLATVELTSDTSAVDVTAKVICTIDNNFVESNIRDNSFFIVTRRNQSFKMDDIQKINKEKSEVEISKQSKIFSPQLIVSKERSLLSARTTLADSIFVIFRGVTLNVSADPSQIYADGTATSTIAVGLYETTSGNPISNHEFTLATTNGIIPAGGMTDAFGTATSTLTSSTTPGTATVTVTAGVSESTTIDFISPAPTNISLTSSSSTILADGESFVTLTATVTDTLNNPVADATVNFNTSLGNLSNSSEITDSNGLATTVLTSSASTTDSTAIVEAILAEDSTTHTNVNVTFRGISINISADPSQIAADGISTSEITVTILESTNYNVVENEPISFSTTLGNVTGPDTTDVNGTATATLTSGLIPGLDTVIVSVGSTLHDTLTIPFLSHNPHKLILSSSSSSILADGESSVTLTATVTDTLNNPVADATVNFNTNLGNLSNSSEITNSNGLATTVLTSSADTSEQIATITAIISGYPSVQDTINITYRGITFTVTSIDTFLLADGNNTTQVTALLIERLNGHPLSNKTTYWSTTLGSIPASSTTNDTGYTAVTLTSGTSSGTAIVTGSFGDTLTSSLSITFVSASDSSIILSWSNPLTGGDGNGDGTDDLTITALFVNESSQPIGGATIEFSLNPNTVGSILSPVTTDSTTGVASTTLRYSSQFVGKNVRVWAISGSVYGYVDITLPDIN